MVFSWFPGQKRIVLSDRQFRWLVVIVSIPVFVGSSKILIERTWFGKEQRKFQHGPPALPPASPAAYRQAVATSSLPPLEPLRGVEPLPGRMTPTSPSAASSPNDSM